MVVRRSQNLGVLRRDHVFAPEEHFLVQALARANTGELDLDVRPNVEA